MNRPRDLDERYTLTDKGLAATQGAKVIPLRLVAQRREPSLPDRLAPLREFHARWGDTQTSDLDVLVLWEELGALIHRLSQETP